ncbi:MAG: TonB-dependent receptor plug domain-containing protein, partial [Azoarcus sp.]|nr:TonB-dependent receptor plug domain-containing protein [Azoarcus sp.]
MKNPVTRRARKPLAWSLAAIGAALSVAPQAFAADQPLEEIQVTGSRIQRPGLNSPMPVTSIQQDELELFAPTTLADGLDALPQFLGSAMLSDTENFFGGGYLGAGGQSNLNLRGVGGNRTLVLIDGRRIVPSNRGGTVDISVLPQGLIRRTEVVTGGASAAYGSDAVTGVTNFLIDREFEGFDIDIRGGITELGDAENLRLSLAAGLALGDRDHLVLGIEGYRSAEITDISDRDWFKAWGDLDFGVNATPRRVRYENVITRAESFGGLVRFGPLAGTQFLDDGTAAPFHAGSVLDLSAQTGLNNVTRANPNGVIQGSQVGGSGDQFNRYSMQQAALERASLYLNYKHAFSDSLSASVQGIFGYSYADNQKVGYQMSGTWPITLYSGNPYLPPAVQAQMTANGIASFQVHKRVAPFDPLHNGRAPLTTDLASLTASVEGELANGWNWNAYYQFGESNRDVEMYGYRVDRMFKGIDAVIDPRTGAITCASTLIEANDGCVPVNILGVGNVSRQALEWLHDKMFTNARIKQHTAEFVLDGEVFSGFGSAGPVFMALGTGWRQDSINQISGDPLSVPLPPPEAPGPVRSE